MKVKNIGLSLRMLLTYKGQTQEDLYYLLEEESPWDFRLNDVTKATRNEGTQKRKDRGIFKFTTEVLMFICAQYNVKFSQFAAWSE